MSSTCRITSCRRCYQKQSLMPTKGTRHMSSDSNPQTLLQLAGANLTPAKVRDASLVLIDLQNEYLTGPIAVANARTGSFNAVHLLTLAREGGAPVLHVAHKGRPGGLFDPAVERGHIVPQVAPL